MPAAPAQKELDSQNASFWDELCGTSFARELGIDTVDEQALRVFDDAYMTFYPYLWQYLQLPRVRTENVLEIGLGFGTVSELLARAGAVYHGVDIAPGPVAMVRERLRMAGLGGEERVRQANALGLPFADATFDRVVSIGCLHHTGDTAKGVSEAFRVLRPGGRAVVMLYNRGSLRQLTQRLRARLARRRGDAWLRARYDANTTGEAAPHVDFVSRADVRRMFARFERVRVDVQNFDPYGLGPVHVARDRFLGNLARLVGVDLYIVADKAS